MNKRMKFLRWHKLVILLALVAAMGLASAALLQYYGAVVGRATVSQSVQISKDGNEWLTCTGSTGEGCTIEDSFSGVAGDTIYRRYYIRNNAGVGASIKIDDEDTPEEVEELGVVIIEENNVECPTDGYTSILRDAYYSYTLPEREKGIICEKIKFNLATQDDSYTVKITVSPSTSTK